MGLDIVEYGYGYGTLHVLRQWALTVGGSKLKLDCEGAQRDCGKCAYCKLSKAKYFDERAKITKFYEFIDHSDCEGGYISFGKFGIKNPSSLLRCEWGDLDKLQEEVKELEKHEEKIPESYKQAWEDFKEDVNGSDVFLRFG